jgi:hypothetical protein
MVVDKVVGTNSVQRFRLPAEGTYSRLEFATDITVGELKNGRYMLAWVVQVDRGQPRNSLMYGYIFYEGGNIVLRGGAWGKPQGEKWRVGKRFPLATGDNIRLELFADAGGMVTLTATNGAAVASLDGPVDVSTIKGPVALDLGFQNGINPVELPSVNWIWRNTTLRVE